KKIVVPAAEISERLPDTKPGEGWIAINDNMLRFIDGDGNLAEVKINCKEIKSAEDVYEFWDELKQQGFNIKNETGMTQRLITEYAFKHIGEEREEKKPGFNF
ncbi:MAG: hypothetical protein Q8L21_01130, partial [Candidatus Komeilibacteria bacterium]|nr:hypothetical protein [Candidatus Komeilibacteria bacterium]